ncbi:Coenzyme F390 synthetase [Hahella chejuensis KCTC 2396]|uniref:Coenzyme F390 synthetase n=1 Tax=Hahella chejuensis (strain KCTC 2396) TaxID=349521 RepID=Q2SAZ0_HAHCH|nr:F390 synthetase-related protein [Hahella chejuensis]ABC32184.1 Coenzyme F390 synthetase [Hahella chejuensis KCTC 2396]
MEKLIILRHFIASRYRRFQSREQLESWQSRRLRRHLDWVCRHAPFYQGYLGKPLQDFPIMSKGLMMDNFDQLNTRSLQRDHLFDIALEAEQSRDFSRSQLGDVTVGLSSGTSGRRGLFLASRAERLEWAGVIFAKLLPSLLGRHRIALLLRADSPLYQTVGRGRIQFHYADLTQPQEQWLAALEAFRPTLLVGSAQALQLCAQYGDRLQPELIISGAEVLTPSDRGLLQQRFACPIKEIYQCTEGFLACTQQDGVLRWNEDFVHIEPRWLNPEKTHFSPIITDFRRRTQPIIRYLLDDVIEAGDEPGVFRAIRSIGGRTGDVLQLPGATSTVTVLPDLLYRAAALASPEPLDYRISQIEAARLRIESDRRHGEIEHAIRAALAKLGVIEALSFEHSPRPQWTPSQKQRRVVNLWSS